MNLATPLKTKLETIAGVGALTFVGAFVGFLSTREIPTTVDGWKPLVAAALATAVAGELVYLRTTIAGLLAGTTLLGTVEQTATSTVTTAVEADVAKVVPKIPPIVGLMLGVLFALLLSACGWFKANGPAITTDLTKDGICVVAEVATGNVDPVSIGVNCGGLAVTQVEAFVAQAIAKLAPPDAGVGATALTPGEVSLLLKLRAVR